MKNKLLISSIIAASLSSQTSFANQNLGFYVKGFGSYNTMSHESYNIRQNHTSYNPYDPYTPYRPVINNYSSGKELTMDGNSSAGYGIAVGFEPTKDIRLELSGSYYPGLSFKYQGDNGFGTIDFEAKQIAANIYVDSAITKNLSWFANLGIGMAMLEGKYRDGRKQDSVELKETIETGKITNSTGLSYIAGLGLAYKITPNLVGELYANYKYLGELDKKKPDGGYILRGYTDLTKNPGVTILEAGVGLRYHL